MKIQRCFAMGFALLLMVSSLAMAEDKKDNKDDACANPNPASLCSADNTCGSASAPCTLDVKRTANSSSVTPSIPKAKGNDLFCIKAGTSVTWMSSSKNVGFLIDFGSSAPFDPPGTITGGADKPVTVVAKNPGCVNYHASATAQGGIYGMSKSIKTEFIVIP